MNEFNYLFGFYSINDSIFEERQSLKSIKMIN